MSSCAAAADEAAAAATGLEHRFVFFEPAVSLIPLIAFSHVATLEHRSSV